MDRPYILHMFTPARHMSPFDINMALDAGYDVAVPYTDVGMDEIRALTQDAIFSRGPKGAARTALFIGGRDAIMAADMLDAARKSMFPPFQVSILADPSGAYTTAAALVASVERGLDKTHKTDYAGKRVLILGGTGPVGRIASVLLAKAGTDVRIASHRGMATAQQAADETSRRFGCTVHAADTASVDALHNELAKVQVVMATAAAGVQVMSVQDRAHAADLLVAADVNAVPPAGIEGVDAMDDGKSLDGGRAVGIGALAVGNIKYQVEQRLLTQMRNATAPVYLAFDEAFATARAVTGE